MPGIDIDPRGDIRQADLTRREVDIAMRFKRPTAPGMAVRQLTEVRYGLFASADDLAACAGRRYCLRSNDLAPRTHFKKRPLMQLGVFLVALFDRHHTRHLVDAARIALARAEEPRFEHPCVQSISGLPISEFHASS